MAEPFPAPGPHPEAFSPSAPPAAAGPQPNRPYGYGAAISSPAGLARAAIALAALLTLVQVGLAVLAWPTAARIDEVARGADGSLGVVMAYDLVALLLLPAGLAAYIVNCLWLHRCRSNAEVVVPQATHARRSLWIWLAWWVPVVNLWFPYQVVRDVDGAHRLGERRTGLALWWTGWLLWLFSSSVADRILTSAGDGSPEGLTAFAVGESVAAVALLVSFVRWAMIVRRTTERQRGWLLTV